MFAAIPVPFYGQAAPSLGVEGVLVNHITLPLFEQKIGFAIRTIIENASCYVCGSSDYGIVKMDSMVSDIFCLECSSFIDTVLNGTANDKYPWARDVANEHF